MDLHKTSYFLYVASFSDRIEYKQFEPITCDLLYPSQTDNQTRIDSARVTGLTTKLLIHQRCNLKSSISSISSILSRKIGEI